MARQWRTTGCDVDMTPMIDVVFQLIIFFIVTMKLEQDINPEIELEDARHGPIIEDTDPRQLTIEVDRRGWISIRNAQFSQQRLYEFMRHRYRQYGAFPVLIRADRRTRHNDVKAVMDICTRVGIWRISFAAVHERKT